MSPDEPAALSAAELRRKGGNVGRRAARIAAVQALYQMDLAATDVGAVIEQFGLHRFGGEDEGAHPQADQPFFAELVRGVVRLQREIDPLIDLQLADGWRLARIDTIMRSILRSAVLELKERLDIPARVVIGEYIDVAHAFFEGEEPKVVNGVLDRLARKLRPAEFNRASEKGNASG